MEQIFSTLRFLLVHMFQEELVLMFLITVLLLWVLNMRLSHYSTKTREASLARKLAALYAGVAATIAVLGRVLR